MTKKFAPYFFALALAVFAMVFYSRNLGHEYISQWDESIHVNVVRNLYNHCCTPMLHIDDLGTGFEDWSNNYVWLHKPLLPFYIRALFFRLFGDSLLVFRLPSALFAAAAVVALFLIGRKLLGLWAGLAAGILLASNNYLFELVQGRQFSDFSDVLFLFFLLGILWFVVVPSSPIKERMPDRSSGSFWKEGGQERLQFVFIPLLAALAYYSKGGLVLPALAVFAIARFWDLKWKAVPGLLTTAGIFLLLIIPGYWYLSSRFHDIFIYEQHQQISHLFKNIEDWMRPWDWYITVYAKNLFDPLLVGALFSAVIASFIKPFRSRKNVLLALWILAYLVPLSFGVSKISNFILPILPAGLLLVVSISADAWKKGKHDLLLSWAGSIIILFLLLHFNVWGFSDAIGNISTKPHRFVLLEVSIALMGLIAAVASAIRSAWLRMALSKVEWAIGRHIQFHASHWLALRRITACIMTLTFLIILSHNLKTNWQIASSVPADYSLQMDMQTSAIDVKNKIDPPNSIVIVDNSTLVNAHLYFQYWSGINSVPKKQEYLAGSILPQNAHLYLLTPHPQPLPLITQEPFGYVYGIR